MRKIGLLASAYTTLAALGFAGVAMVAGDLYLMVGFEILMLLGAISWLIFGKGTARAHECSECRHVLPSHRARFHAGHPGPFIVRGK